MNDVDTALPTDDELEAQRAKIKNAPDPRKMRGCGKPNADYLYRQGAPEAEMLSTPAFDPCGHPFMSPPFGPPSILLCRECAVKNGVRW
jgi:hypothetical protein